MNAFIHQRVSSERTVNGRFISILMWYLVYSAVCGNYLVRVRAQVMTRDDSSGGWVPLSGGGLANVSVRRRSIAFTGTHQPGTINGTSIPTTIAITPAPSTTNSAHSTGTITNSQGHGSLSNSPPAVPKRRYEYLIYGKRITDQSVVLSCTIKKDFEYNKVMPTFHHWRTGEKKFGLTFQTAADARAFDKGVRTAVQELLEGLAEQSSLSNENGQADGAGDDEVFMTLNLPVEPPEPRQSTDATPRGIVRIPNYHSQCSDLLDSHRPIHYIDSSSIVKMPPHHHSFHSQSQHQHHHPLESRTTDIASDNYPYVQLTTLNHEYLYPVIDDQQQQQQQQQHQYHKTERLDHSSSTGSLKKPDILAQQPTKASSGMTGKTGRANLRLRCKHCQELYTEQHNPRGACEYAPDPVRRGIATVSCLSCAQCMLYHCMSDAEGDFAQNPCSCSTEEGCSRRWLGLALLSLIVPCLWIYPPLRAVHWCGMSCGMCGGRHHPME
ncbi:sprouty-related, EVH1 domain-containing protein 1 isoform X1 [Nasonia vitripennis]|uniref:WH1 domain-containing protein n=1 Tax=Nasonia vitripennis TaxID=7425 RepID=A0A7M7IWB7_NASVI|nr:sprouty-related, EVH1 domain-containing protein 1 isoform X1 [Nasonia vitripennis]